MMFNEIELSSVITDIAAGPFGSKLKVSCFVPYGFPIIDGANLKGFKVTDNLTKFVTEEKARSLSRSIARRGDVIITISGTLGQIAYIPDDSMFEEYLCSQRQFRVSFDSSRVYVPYLVFYFHTNEGQGKILSFANQTGVPALSQPLKNFRKIRIQLPSYTEQRRIASVIEAINDKIECNQKVNDNLEQQASAMVDQYFESVSSTVSFSDIMSFESGFAFQSSTYLPNGQYRIITIKNVQDGQIDTTGAAYIDELPQRMKSGCLLQVGDALLSLTGNVGRTGIVCENDLLLNQRVAKIVPHRKELLPLLYFIFRQPSMKTQLESIAKGTAQLNLSHVETLKLSVPYDVEVSLKLANALAPIYQAVIANNQQSLILASIRDLLLPKLMSGEIDVSDIQL